MLRLAPDLPEPVVGLRPVVGEVVDQGPLERPAQVGVVEPGLARLLQRDHHLAQHVGLPLVDRAVADPDRAWTAA